MALPPSEAGVLPPSRRPDPGLGGGLCIMQDTPNSYLEVERRDPFLGILGRGLGRREEFAFVNLCPSGSSWPPLAVGRARLKIVRTCALHDCVVRFGSFRVVPGAVLWEHVEIHCSGHIFRRQSVSHFRRLCSREALRRCVQGWHVGDFEMPQQVFRLSEIYTNPGHFLCSGATRSPRALPCRRRTRLVERSALSILAK